MEVLYVTIGNTTFNKEGALKLGYTGFKKAYGKILKTPIDEAWIALGGKIDKPKKQTNEVREA